MTALLILGGILLLLALLLSSHLVLKVRYTDALRLKVGMLGIYLTLLSPEKKQKKENESPKKRQKREQKARKKQRRKEQKQKRKSARKAASRAKRKGTRKQKIDAAQKAPPPKSFPETVSFVLDILRAIFPPVGGMLRHLKLHHLDVCISVGSQDAAKTALSFVKISTAVHQTCALLATQMQVRIQRIDIRPNFCSEKMQQEFSFTMKIRLIRILLAALVILYNVVKLVLFDKNKDTATDKATVKNSSDNNSPNAMPTTSASSPTT